MITATQTLSDDMIELFAAEIGAEIGVNESRVSQLHPQAVARLRASLKEKLWTSPA